MEFIFRKIVGYVEYMFMKRKGVGYIYDEVGCRIYRIYV